MDLLNPTFLQFVPPKINNILLGKNPILTENYDGLSIHQNFVTKIVAEQSIL